MRLSQIALTVRQTEWSYNRWPLLRSHQTEFSPNSDYREAFWVVLPQIPLTKKRLKRGVSIILLHREARKVALTDIPYREAVRVRLAQMFLIERHPEWNYYKFPLLRVNYRRVSMNFLHRVVFAQMFFIERCPEWDWHRYSFTERYLDWSSTNNPYTEALGAGSAQVDLVGLQIVVYTMVVIEGL